MIYKNIHLFQGKNTLALGQQIQGWKGKFREKHWEMNLIDISKSEINESFMSDSASPGFMGMTRMIVLRDILLKSDKELKEIEKEGRKKGEGSKIIWETWTEFNDEIWIKTLSRAPDTNFFLFVWNISAATSLEKWLIQNATIHTFPLPSSWEIQKLLLNTLWVTSDQAFRIQRRLNNNYNLIYQEIQKLTLVQQWKWSDEDLQRILPNYFEENNFTILNPLWNKDANELLYVFRDALRTADRELTMAMITTIIRKVLIACFLSDTSLSHLPDIKSSQITLAKKIRHERVKIQKLFNSIVSIDADEKRGESTGKLDAFLMALITYCVVPELL